MATDTRSRDRPDEPADHRFADLDPATLAVRDLVASSRELTGRMARRMAMNANDMAAVGALVQLGPMGVTDLARHLGITSASATVMVDRLQRAGHAQRVRDEDDRRRVRVVETPAARAASYDAWAPAVLAIDEVCRTLGEAERRVVVDLLRRVAAVTDQAALDPSAQMSDEIDE